MSYYTNLVEISKKLKPLNPVQDEVFKIVLDASNLLTSTEQYDEFKEKFERVVSTSQFKIGFDYKTKATKKKGGDEELVTNNLTIPVTINLSEELIGSEEEFDILASDIKTLADYYDILIKNTALQFKNKQGKQSVDDDDMFADV